MEQQHPPTHTPTNTHLESPLQVLGVAGHVKVAVATQRGQDDLALTSLLAPAAAAMEIRKILSADSTAF